MRFQLKTLLAAALLVALAASPASALCLLGLGCGSDPPGGNGVGAPGPIAGAGLAYLVLAGGYYAVRRWRKQNTGE